MHAFNNAVASADFLPMFSRRRRLPITCRLRLVYVSFTCLKAEREQNYGFMYVAKKHLLGLKNEDLYDLRVELYDLRVLFHEKAVLLCAHLNRK